MVGNPHASIKDELKGSVTADNRQTKLAGMEGKRRVKARESYVDVRSANVARKLGFCANCQ